VLYYFKIRTEFLFGLLLCFILELESNWSLSLTVLEDVMSAQGLVLVALLLSQVLSFITLLTEILVAVHATEVGSDSSLVHGNENGLVTLTALDSASLILASGLLHQGVGLVTLVPTLLIEDADHLVEIEDDLAVLDQVGFRPHGHHCLSELLAFL